MLTAVSFRQRYDCIPSTVGPCEINSCISYRGYMAIFLILTPDGAFLVTLLVLQSAQLGFAATFLPRE